MDYLTAHRNAALAREHYDAAGASSEASEIDQVVQESREGVRRNPRRRNPEVLTGAVREGASGPFVRTWEQRGGKRRVLDLPVPPGVQALPDWRVDLAHGARKLSRPVPELRGAGCRDTPLTYCGADGSVRGSAAMAGGRSIEYVWRVVPLDDLVTSHDPWTLAVAKEFPAELQPRDRSRSSYQDQIRRLVANFDPSLLFWSPNVSDGAPIIGPDGVVESGNGRTMALKRIFRAESDARDAYVDLAKRWARELGVKWPAKVDDPVLVRERLTKLDRAEFARLANVAGQQKMAAAEQALADAGQLDEDTLALYRPDAELETGANAGFVEAFIQRVAGPEARGDITDARGKLSAPGKDRILYALFAKAYGVEAESLLEMLAEQTDPEIRSVLRGMEQAAPMWASFTAAIGRGVYDRQYDLTRDLVQMARRLVDAKSRGLTVRALRSQADFVEGLSPAADLLLAVAHPAGGRPNAANLSATLADFVARVERQGPLSQGGMFDLPPVAAQKLLELAARHVVLDELDPQSARGRELGEWLARKNPAAESKLSQRQRQRYLGKLTGAKRAARAAEIVHRRAHRSTAPFATDVGQPTRRSAHARRFEAQFGRPPVDVADAAKLTGLPVSILRQVYGRGMAAWQTGHRPGASAHAWAMARVQSFATGGPTATGPDADLARKSLATARKRGQAGALAR